MKRKGDFERVVRGKCGDLGGVVAEMTIGETLINVGEYSIARNIHSSGDI